MTTKTVEEPVTVADERFGDKETITTHPAFGQICVHRYSGGNKTLYGSDFQHNTYIGISIHKSKLHRNLGRDWHHASSAPIVEVLMSEAQWATFVSSFGHGGGTPCTLDFAEGRPIPSLPAPTARTDQFESEMRKSLDNVVKRVDALIEGAKTKAQKTELEMLRQQIVSNLPFVAQQFDRHMEKTVEAGKQEIHGYMNSVISRAGLTALTKGEVPLVLEDKSDV